MTGEVSVFGYLKYKQNFFKCEYIYSTSPAYGIAKTHCSPFIRRVAINGIWGGEGPPPKLEIKVGRFVKKLASLGKKLAGCEKSWQVWVKSWQIGEKVGRFAKIVGRLGKKLAG